MCLKVKFLNNPEVQIFHHLFNHMGQGDHCQALNFNNNFRELKMKQQLLNIKDKFRFKLLEDFLQQGVAQLQMNLLEITNLIIILVHLMVESKEVWSVGTINFIRELGVLQDLILTSKLNNNRDLPEAGSQEAGVNISSIIQVILLTPQIENYKVSHLL
jgi:hypothetical protein